MFGIFGRAWSWLVDGLTDASLMGFDRLDRRAAIRIEACDGSASVRGSDGADLGRCFEEAATLRLEPPDLAKRLAGQAIDVAIPPAWLFRRALEPVAAQSAPFLDAFVRHHIDRITPWRAADVHYRIVQAPLPGDPARLSVEVGVVPKQFVAALVTGLGGLGAKSLRLLAPASDGGPPFAIPIADGRPGQRVRVRQYVLALLSIIGFGLPVGFGWVWWQTTTVQAEIDAADQVIAQRKAVLAAAARRDHAGTEVEAALEQLRASRPRAVDLIEALSAALPDQAYLTDLTIEKDHVRVSGVSTNTPQLVPALETSGRFADAAFFEATTRLETGQGDRFHIEMRSIAGLAGAKAP